MSEFISGNVGIVRKEDIFCLEISEPDYTTSGYRIIATCYKNNKLQIVHIERGKTFFDISKSFERMKKEIEGIE